MSRVSFSAGEVPPASKLNAVADQCVIQASSAPSSPPEGMLWYDTSAPHPLVYAYNGSVWWPVPMGLIPNGKTQTTGDTGIGGGGRTVAGSQLTVQLEDNQRYRYEGVIVCSATVDNTVLSVNVQRDGTDIDVQKDVVCTYAYQSYPVPFNIVDGPGAGTYLYRLHIALSIGSGAGIVAAGADITMSHVGSTSL